MAKVSRDLLGWDKRDKYHKFVFRPDPDSGEFKLPGTIEQFVEFPSDLGGVALTAHEDGATVRRAGELILSCKVVRGGLAVKVAPGKDDIARDLVIEVIFSEKDGDRKRGQCVLYKESPTPIDLKYGYADTGDVLNPDQRIPYSFPKTLHFKADPSFSTLWQCVTPSPQDKPTTISISTPLHLSVEQMLTLEITLRPSADPAPIGELDVGLKSNFDTLVNERLSGRMTGHLTYRTVSDLCAAIDYDTAYVDYSNTQRKLLTASNDLDEARKKGEEEAKIAAIKQRLDALRDEAKRQRTRFVEDANSIRKYADLQPLDAADMKSDELEVCKAELTRIVGKCNDTDLRGIREYLSGMLAAIGRCGTMNNDALLTIVDPWGQPVGKVTMEFVCPSGDGIRQIKNTDPSVTNK